MWEYANEAAIAVLKFIPIIIYIIILYPSNLCNVNEGKTMWKISDLITTKMNSVMKCVRSRAGFFMACVSAYLFLLALIQIRLKQGLKTTTVRHRTLRYWMQVLFLISLVCALQIFLILVHMQSTMHYLLALLCLLVNLVFFMLVFYNILEFDPSGDKYVLADRTSSSTNKAKKSVPLGTLLTAGTILVFFLMLMAALLFGTGWRGTMSIMEYLCAGLYMLAIIML